MFSIDVQDNYQYNLLNLGLRSTQRLNSLAQTFWWSKWVWSRILSKLALFWTQRGIRYVQSGDDGVPHRRNRWLNYSSRTIKWFPRDDATPHRDYRSLRRDDLEQQHQPRCHLCVAAFGLRCTHSYNKTFYLNKIYCSYSHRLFLCYCLLGYHQASNGDLVHTVGNQAYESNGTLSRLLGHQKRSFIHADRAMLPTLLLVLYFHGYVVRLLV